MSRHQTSATPLRPLLALAHPLWVIALVVLVFNDHFLKRAGIAPQVVTGKLSDFAGLWVAAPLFAVVVRARSARAMKLAYLAVGAGFALLELSAWATSLAASAYQWAGFAYRSWSDPTDLLALLVLPLCYRVSERLARSPDKAPWLLQRSRPLGAMVAVVACAGSTSDPFLVEPCGIACEPFVPLGTDQEMYCDDDYDDDSDGATDCDDQDCLTVCADLNAACALADQEVIAVVDRQSVAMSTLGRDSVTESSCDGADVPDDLIKLELPGPGTLFATIPPDHALSLRSDCNAWGSELSCENQQTAPSGIAAFEISQGEVYTLVAHAQDGLLAASFDVDLVFVARDCGNGELEVGEQCDDGNADNSDGCDMFCHADYAVFCDGAVELLLGDTAGSLDVGASLPYATCGGGGPNRAEHIYRYVSDTDGLLRVTLSGAERLSLFETNDCPSQSPLFCQTTSRIDGQVSLAASLSVGEVRYFVVEATEELGLDPSYLLNLTFE